MGLGNILVGIVAIYYVFYILTLIVEGKQRKQIKIINNQLNTLRKISIKNLDEQKEFLNLKYPKYQKSKFTINTFISIVKSILIYSGLFYILMWIFNYYNIEILIWQGILFMIFFPVLCNIILEKFNLQKGDLTIFFKKFNNK